MRTVLAALWLTAGAGTVVAQTDYTFQMRLIPDGAAGAPTGSYPQYPINGNGGDSTAVRATRVGFWLQARVAQNGGENWGIVRASSPEGGGSFISASAPAGSLSLSRGLTNSAASPNPRYGRGAFYRESGDETGQTGNAPGSVPFPGTGGNENGGLDNGGSGSLSTRIYAFDAYVGSTRPAAVVDDAPAQPWGVNGATSGPSIGNPVPSDGTFSPWASLYRVWIDFSVSPNAGAFEVVVSASAWLNGAVQAVPTDEGMNTWEMQAGPGQLLTANYTFTYGIWPTPGAACALALGGAHASRRRR